jgi:hypothetical protein
MREQGTFHFAAEAANPREISAIFSGFADASARAKLP